MKVKELMSAGVEMINSDASLAEAAELMRSRDKGVLPVCEADEIVGVITDRDIVIRAIAKGKDPSKTFVGEIMTPEAYYCFEEDDITDAARQMEDQAIRRLLVFNTDYEPVGMISLADFAVKSHDEHLTHEVLECVCEGA
ncbi:MAG: CBS domain-containing protein [Phycisphaerae bacterium]|nr:CBS domain-containing protein [Phycisphaerae bacterium]